MASEAAVDGGAGGAASTRDSAEPGEDLAASQAGIANSDATRTIESACFITVRTRAGPASCGGYDTQPVIRRTLRNFGVSTMHRNLLIAIVLLVGATAAHAKTYHVYVLAGQSNMDGYGSVKDVPADMRGPVEGVRIFHSPMLKDGQPATGRGVWSALRAGHGKDFAFDGKANKLGSRFGAELTFAQRIRELRPDQNVALVKYSRGGTSIALDASARKRFGAWDPDYQDGEGINQYDHFLATLRNATAVRDIDGDGEDDTLVPAGILWMQGESDAQEPGPAARYEANLKRLMDLMRAAMRVDDLPVVIGRISDSFKGGKRVWQHGPTVRAGMAAFVANDPASALVTSTDAYGYSDPWHYNSAGYLDLGKRFADALHGINRDATAVRQALYMTTTSGKKIVVYHVDPKTGALASAQELDLPGASGPMAISNDRRFLYAAVRGKPQRVQVFTIDRATGKLTPGALTELTGNPTYLDVDATGRWLLAAYYGDGMATVHAINTDGTVTPGPVQTVKLERNAHALLLDRNNRFGYVPATGPNLIWQFTFDAGKGQLTAHKAKDVAGGESERGKRGPRHYAYHPTLDRVYAVNEIDSSVTVWSHDYIGGGLTATQSLSTLPADFKERNTCADIHVTPNGKYVYASNRGHDSLAAYRVDPRNGSLTFIDRFATESVPREFEIDTTGRFVYAAGQKTNKLACYRIDDATGRLTRFATVDTPGGPIWVTAMELD